MEGEASLLDKSLVIFGSPMADANIHNHRRCPLVLFGHANGMLKGNMHLKAADATPMANVFLTLMHNLGLEDLPVVWRQHGRVLARRRASTTARCRADSRRGQAGPEGPAPTRRLRMRFV